VNVVEKAGAGIKRMNDYEILENLKDLKVIL
jgi:hypothetical protein